jgi:ribonuclease HI
MLRLYTDGACSNNGRGSSAKAGWACVFPDNISASRGGPLDTARYTSTNQSAELCAILEGVLRAKDLAPPASTELRVYTDSQYALSCLTKWVIGWKKNGWKTSSGGQVIHRELIEHILAELVEFKGYSFMHVPAHTGKQDEHSRWNALADSLARKAVEESREVLPTIEVEAPVMDAPILPGIPLQMMGGPVEEAALIRAVRSHIESLDSRAVDVALLMALKKTLSQHGYELESSKVNRVKLYRLVSKNRLTVETKDLSNNDED